MYTVIGITRDGLRHSGQGYATCDDKRVADLIAAHMRGWFPTHPSTYKAVTQDEMAQYEVSY